MDWIQKVGLAKACVDFLESLGGPTVLPVEALTPPPALNKLLADFSDIFRDELGCCGQTASIQVRPDAQLKIFPFRRPPIHFQKQIEAELDRLAERGVFEPINNALCAFQTVNVMKPSGAIRICGDFKPVNKSLIVDQYPIPRPSDLFSTLVGGQKFSKLDLSDAYNQLKLDPESQKYLVINTHKGLFRFCRLPFGVSSAPAIFQRVMNYVLADLKGITVFFDDVLVTGSSDGEHLQNLSAVFQRLKQHGLRLKKNKCSFFQSSVKYLGHIIDKDGIRPSNDKVKAIQEMPIPRDQAELRSFLGLVTYFSQFFLCCLIIWRHQIIC